MEIKITKGKAEFNTSPLGDSKEVVFVEFPNCISTTTGKSFKWMPTYRQLQQIKLALDDIEKESWNAQNDMQKDLDNNLQGNFPAQSDNSKQSNIWTTW